MSETSIVAIIVAVLAILGGGGFWGYRQFAKEAPVRKRDADIAVAEKSQQMALAVADDLREDYIRLRTDLNAEREERQKLTGRVDSLETHIREQDKTIRTLRDAVRLFTAAWDDLTNRWAHYRQSENPPPRPNVNID
ncbi:hypothetical protein [Glutamicibacter nicotianae]|uniref:hypothetical protein n=1 Tax=Glutamicibacter nicotianae TaxID=37929 RepID=UPI00167F3DB0|nr:hypothetical protein [Glutamicibacter nicotianae]